MCAEARFWLTCLALPVNQAAMLLLLLLSRSAASSGAIAAALKQSRLAWLVVVGKRHWIGQRRTLARPD